MNTWLDTRHACAFLKIALSTGYPSVCHFAAVQYPLNETATGPPQPRRPAKITFAPLPPSRHRGTGSDTFPAGVCSPAERSRGGVVARARIDRHSAPPARIRIRGSPSVQPLANLLHQKTFALTVDLTLHTPCNRLQFAFKLEASSGRPSP
ncbi:unnamed protein product, partial [Iphiclides podalirius]